MTTADILVSVPIPALPALAALLLAVPGAAAPGAAPPGNTEGVTASSTATRDPGKTGGTSSAKVTKTPAKTPLAPPQPPPLCDGDYADALPPEVASRVADESAKTGFVFAIRSIATYEHIYYGRDGKLHKQYLRAVAHGTGVAWKVLNGETYLVTNEHVASRPDVTDDDHAVEGIPPGSKKVREQLKIVKDESDDYEPGHIPLTKVMSDPPADIAVLKAKKILPLMPFRFGRSSALRAGNVVQVRGFPLGVFTALSSGKVVNPYARDSEKGWAHVDFVIDALLSAGNSGSPVFAISCRTGEPELVGIFHAGYTDAAALNVVVGIDQLKDELETFKVPKRDPAGLGAELTAADRDRMVQALFAEPSHALTIPFGGRAARVTLVDPDTLRFSILTEDFPLLVQESMALVDHAHAGLGTLAEVGLPVNDLVVDVPARELDPDARDHFEKLQDSLWRQLVSVIDYRALATKARASADAFSSAQDIAARIRRRASDQKDLLGLCSYDAEQAGVPAVRADGSAAVSSGSAADGGAATLSGAQATSGASAGAGSPGAAPTAAGTPDAGTPAAGAPVRTAAGAARNLDGGVVTEP